MMKFLLHLGVLIFALLLTSSSAWKEYGPSNVRIKRNDNTDCGCSSKLFEKGTNCCDVPVLLPLAAVLNCSAGFIQNDRQLFRMLGICYGKKSRATVVSTTTTATTNVTKLIQKENYMNATGGRTCIFDCVFRNQGLVGPDGVLNVALLTAKFKSILNTTAWKNITIEGLSTCVKLINEVNTAEIWTPVGERKCLPWPALLMSCLGKHNLKFCPESMKFKGNLQPGETCNAILQDMNKCDVFGGIKKLT